MKRLLITHVADADGAGPIILSKLTFDDIDFISVDTDEVDTTLEENLDKYDIIYITDLNISDKLASTIENSNYKNKVLVFDHHHSNLDRNKYSFITVIDERNGKKECGTTLYYEYLKSNFDNKYLHKQSLEFLVELTRQLDTWDFIKLKDQAFNLGSLYEIYGREKYIDKYYDLVINSENFEWSEIDKTVLDIEENNKKNYIDEVLKETLEKDIDGYKVGIVFAERYRSSLGHIIAEKYDIGVVINLHHVISYRADNANDIDVSIVASKYGGGGHVKASGSPLPAGLKEKIISYIFD